MVRTMSKSPSKTSTGSSSLAPWLGIALIVILFDQLTKIAVQKVFAYGVAHAITTFFNLVLVYNRGAAFSFLAMAGGCINPRRCSEDTVGYGAQWAMDHQPQRGTCLAQRPPNRHSLGPEGTL